MFYKEDLIGSVVLSNISYSFKSTDWAFYVTESSTKGVGAAIEFKLIEMIFNEKNFEILKCEVLNFNICIHEWVWQEHEELYLLA